MNVASLDLCRELYELSGWYDIDMFTWSKYHVVGTDKGFKSYESFRIEFGGPEDIESRAEKDSRYPAYDLGFLLRKLPALQLNKMKPGGQSGFDYSKYDWYMARINGGRSKKSTKELNQFRKEADTPEDALAQLAIELFKAGLLQPGKGSRE